MVTTLNLMRKEVLPAMRVKQEDGKMEGLESVWALEPGCLVWI